MYSSLPAYSPFATGGGGGESLIKDLKRQANSLSRDLKRQANSLSRDPGRPALLVWRGDPRPSKTAPLGMTKTPTLRVSADLLDLNAGPPLPGPPLGVTERGRACYQHVVPSDMPGPGGRDPYPVVPCLPAGRYPDPDNIVHTKSPHGRSRSLSTLRYSPPLSAFALASNKRLSAF